jgi:hypothetical protein
MSNGYQQAQGFGAQSAQTELQRQFMERQKQEWELAQGLAGLPDTELAYNWLEDNGPQGAMVSGRYVAPSWSQHMANAAKMGMGGLMVNNRNVQAKALAAELAKRYGNPAAENQAGVMPLPNPEVDSLYGQ